MPLIDLTSIHDIKTYMAAIEASPCSTDTLYFAMPPHPNGTTTNANALWATSPPAIPSKPSFCDDQMEEQYRLKRLRREAGESTPPRMTHYHRQRAEIQLLRGVAADLTTQLGHLQAKHVTSHRGDWYQALLREKQAMDDSISTNIELRSHLQRVLQRREGIQNAVFAPDDGHPFGF
ncbi:hypothetical protein SPRG_19020 [Saprolegnia parasitica CBS 223.65]|uniref:Uncharacterized protein n=1 Tax=Saprolegnia parasitica (strain CBS 223.65) TaxID=695850 RepID=A0A067CY72_SAPPC|nr:hypothetical protein SPRG_19020 [Saprolegnia parasitica CBS 223.65]KDO34170.1 hypothetical protein SPRG_19020 [Saprolegnia parasitica CBS 223.65]|eukprot:XP_012195219.1 hypothetical protein SPRG_19020 [Saprolegnia parasitica CBS 223.65]